MLQLRVLMLQLKIPLATTKKISHAHIPQLKNKTNKHTNKNSHTITKTPRASTKNWCTRIKKRQKLTPFLPHNFCGSRDQLGPLLRVLQGCSQCSVVWAVLSSRGLTGEESSRVTQLVSRIHFFAVVVLRA